MREIVWDWAAWKDIERLPLRARERIITVVDSLAAEPAPTGVKMLKGGTHLFRVRVGDYRVAYSVESNRIVIRGVGDRKDIYRGI